MKAHVKPLIGLWSIATLVAGLSSAPPAAGAGPRANDADRSAAASSSSPAALASAPSLYVEFRLAHPVKVSKLRTGEVLEGALSRDIYAGDRLLFAAGRRVQVTVGKLERRRREPNDHWPGVVRLFTPRHQNYPTFAFAEITSAEGVTETLQTSLVSIGRRAEIHARTKSKPAPKQASDLAPDAGRENHGETAPSATAVEAPPPPSLDRSQTVILEAARPPAVDRVASPVIAGAPPAGPVTLPTGTTAQVVLLSAVSASKSRVGDSFRAQLVEPVRLGSATILPAGSIFEGKVVKATPPRTLSRPGSLFVTFTGLSLPGSTSLPVMATPTGAELDTGSHTRLDSEGGLRAGNPGKAWMLINLAVTSGISKEADDATQLVIEALVSTATDASTAGVAKIVAAVASGVYLVTRHGRDVILPRFTEMDITLNRAVSLPAPASTAARAEERLPESASRVP